MTNVVITGASSGIGAALARLYAGHRARLLLIARDAARLARVAAECRARAAAVETASVDVRHRAELAAVLRDFDARHAIDVIVANAGVTSILEPEAAVESGEDFQRVLETNLVGAFNTVGPVAERMAARGAGRIGLIGSLAGLRGLPYSPAYSASKAGLKAMGEAMRAKLRPHGVSLTIASLGFVVTPLDDGIESPKPWRMTPERAAARIAAAVAAGRAHVAFPLPLASATRFLAFLPPRVGDALLRLVTVTRRKAPD
ncbi:MAG TPA: SDR family NAD(P)-dependent oxidoreductase [Alphaproteobacteria bacterium]|jgi:short-subunit dehydrogenase